MQEPRVRRVDRAFDRLRVVDAFADLHDRVLVARQLHPVVVGERRAPCPAGPRYVQTMPPASCTGIALQAACDRGSRTRRVRSACPCRRRRRRTSSRDRCSAGRPLRYARARARPAGAGSARRSRRRCRRCRGRRPAVRRRAACAPACRRVRRLLRSSTPAPSSGASSAPIGASPVTRVSRSFSSAESMRAFLVRQRE